jgi:hypothetical protein
MLSIDVLLRAWGIGQPAGKGRDYNRRFKGAG